MRANCRHGKDDVRVETVPNPKLPTPADAIIRITSSAICGSDLYGGFVPTIESGDIVFGYRTAITQDLKPNSIPGRCREASHLFREGLPS